MNKRWITRGIAAAGALSLLAMAMPAFAAAGPEGPGTGKEASKTSALTLSCSTGSLVGGKPQYVCTVSNIDITTSKTTIFFRALNSTQLTKFNESSFGQAGSSNQSHDDSGTILNGLQGVTITPTPVNHFQTPSETFTLSGAIPSSTVAFSAGQYSQDRTKEYSDESVTKLTPPVGQLPEVPYAAALPIVGLGVGILLWRRSKKLSLR